MKQIIEIGKTLQHNSKTFVASTPIKHEQCFGCDFQFWNGEHNECHAPDDLYCGGRIFKNVTLEYEQDSCFDHDFDTTGIICFISILFAFIGSLIAAIGVAIYYLIINLF